MRSHIPKELQELPQWVCAGVDKVPMNPRTGAKASPTDRATWATFNEAVSTGYQNIGFVLSTSDPYTIIDLDDPFKRGRSNTIIKEGDQDYGEALKIAERHSKLINYFESYTELSQSGAGAHIIVKGSIPHGVRRDKVEVYSTERYMICTGNVVKPLAIFERQELLDQLYKEMGEDRYEATLHQTDSVIGDEAIFAMAAGAVNADKFNTLCQGLWEGAYESQSEADLALLAIFAFYTKDNEQVRRLFRMSALGKRDKAIKNDRYLDYALKRIRGNELPPVDLSQLVLEPPTEEVLEEPKQLPARTDTPKLAKKSDFSFPPGLVGEVAEYIFSSSYRPVKEIALAAAIGLVAGITGRSYNISGTGLNQYLVLLARTGAGKEGAATGIDALIAAVRETVPMADQFIGPGSFASGQALIRILDTQACFISILGEFGLTLQQLCDPRANSNQLVLKKVLLDLYSKSGWNKVLRSSVYSDSDKNTRIVQAPNITILGESTPEAFFDGLDQSHIIEGLIPRFMIIEYAGKRPPKNPNAFHPPGEGLVRRLADVITVALNTSQNFTCSPVGLTAEAITISDTFDVFCDNQINSAGLDAEMQLWNRAHLKALKLAGLLAVGCNPHAPVVTEAEMLWAVEFVRRDVGIILNRFQSGEIGVGDHRQEADIRTAIEDYLVFTTQQKYQYKVPKRILDLEIIPYTYLRRRLRLRSSFKNDRRGTNLALQMVLEELVKAGILQQIPPMQVRSEYSIESPLYILGEAW